MSVAQTVNHYFIHNKWEDILSNAIQIQYNGNLFCVTYVLMNHMCLPVHYFVICWFMYIHICSWILHSRKMMPISNFNDEAQSVGNENNCMADFGVVAYLSPMKCQMDSSFFCAFVCTPMSEL